MYIISHIFPKSIPQSDHTQSLRPFKSSLNHLRSTSLPIHGWRNG